MKNVKASAGFGGDSPVAVPDTGVTESATLTAVTVTVVLPLVPAAVAPTVTVCVPVGTVGAVSVAVATPVGSVAENGSYAACRC